MCQTRAETVYQGAHRLRHQHYAVLQHKSAATLSCECLGCEVSCILHLQRISCSAIPEEVDVTSDESEPSATAEVDTIALPAGERDGSAPAVHSDLTAALKLHTVLMSHVDVPVCTMLACQTPVAVLRSVMLQRVPT